MSDRLVVVGGGAGGPSAAAKAKREAPELDVQLFERGPHVSYAACPMPYYISGRIPGPENLIARTPEKFLQGGIHVHLDTSIESIDLDGGSVIDSHGERWAFDSLVYATGASSHLPDIPGVDSPRVFALKDLRDGIRIRTFAAENNVRSALILGAGFIALEMAEAFRELALETTILYRGQLPARQFGAELSEAILEELRRNGVDFVTEAVAEGIEDGVGGVKVTTNRGTFDADLVLVALGVRPNVDLACAAGIRLGDTGAVWTDTAQRTSRPNVFAAGDCTETPHLVSGRPVYVPLGDVANKQGRVAGVNVAGGSALFPGVLGSQCFKVFGLEAARSGLNEEQARQVGLDPVSTLIKGRTRAGAYPGAQPIQVRLVAERSTGRLLGIQAVGGEGAVGRANVVAAGLSRGMTLGELSLLDLCYAPPFSPAWDPLHIAAQECLKKI